MSELFITAKPDPQAEVLAKGFVDLAHPRLGTEVIYATDDFFAPKERLIDPEPPVFVPGKYDDHGKWMDGWESRRKRVAGHDWCVVRLGRRGRIRAVDIDTSFFTGNFPPEAQLEAWSGEGDPGDAADWTVIVPRMDLKGDSHNVVDVDPSQAWTHLRLHIYPDGGVARLRVYGVIDKDWSTVSPDEEIDLAAMVNGGIGVIWNDAHYGVPANMLAPGRGVNMGDGWETARRRKPGNDWCVVKLGHAGTIGRVVVDTKHFKGNFPDRCSLRGALLTEGKDPETIGRESADWPILLPEVKLSADAEHPFGEELAKLGPVTHVRLDIYPDGGVSRLRLFGKIA